MRAISTVFLLLLIINDTYGQLNNNSNYDLDIRLGYSITTDGSLENGFSLGMEPRLWLGQKFSIGVKADLHRFNLSRNFSHTRNDVAHSIVVISDFYSSDETDDQLFAGLGYGFHDDYFRSGSGITGRVGYLKSEFRISFEYNLRLNNDSGGNDYYGIYFSWSPF